MANVLVFGATGQLGRATALEAHKRGANVSLAVRDTNKPIKGLDGKDDFPRIQADLTQPESLKAAVEKSGATAAFVYTIPTSPDNMKASFEALTSAGIKYVVVISSYSVKGAAEDPKNNELFISGAHAKTELALASTGVAFSALRPGWFASNLSQNKAGIVAGEASLLRPTAVFDWIAPEDIGAVAGALLVKGESTKALALCGPKLYEVQDACKLAGEVLGKDVKIKEIDEETWLKAFPHPLPKPVADSLTGAFRKATEGEKGYPTALFEEGVENVRKYAGREPIALRDWVDSHRELFA